MVRVEMHDSRVTITSPQYQTSTYRNPRTLQGYGNWRGRYCVQKCVMTRVYEMLVCGCLGVSAFKVVPLVPHVLRLKPPGIRQTIDSLLLGT